MEPVDKLPTASLVADAETGERTTTVCYPHDHRIYPGTALLGRGTSVIGGRRGPLPELGQLGNAEKLREGNGLVAETYWPESRTSEAKILRKAKEDGERIDFTGNHIPEMVCHLDPGFLCNSTKTICQFPGLPTGGPCRPRIIVFRRLRPIKDLKGKYMLTANLHCLFCKYTGKT